ncbi:acyltransferase family protein [Paraburkholderia caballeronis]|uniref:acyltransferase family protein n=1 Tax=Paraburkholderia caballeronis TaxID=416943 RepID=UPI001064E104|nr:acyltransferase [Paraburkholderia caballeronis]TDV09211.1 peptidoglycan/LPS O-acetylase OafA/YrhL [Paraburkholderia caballeronis]TDV12271.1 peptidoglycan/LPS O-acetylase OafA/YrhL [Paraburkholderia caballeronis]TDV22744.1 peptidoglycan/LPS O-acetylase OafA/YrhL [Paraburkholderia caballeronis]
MDANTIDAARTRIDYLEILRFMLAFLTMAWHYYYFAPHAGVTHSMPVDFPGFRYASFTVEVFFIVSGFIIIASAINRKPVDFLFGRIVRLGPCLVVCATITLAVAMLSPRGVDLSDYLASVLIFPLAFHDGMDWAYWSLRFEVIFYALIFVAACFVDIRRNVFRIALLLIAYDAIVLALLSIYDPAVGDLGDVSFALGEYASFFAIGLLLYLLLVEKRRSWAIGLALLVACVIAAFRCHRIANIVSKLMHEPQVGIETGFAIFAVVLVVFVAFVRTERRPRVARLFARLGRTSYPLYLVHQNTGYSAIKLFENRLHLTIDTRPFVMIAMVVLSWVIANHLEPVLASLYKKGLAGVSQFGRATQVRLFGSKGTLP